MSSVADFSANKVECLETEGECDHQIRALVSTMTNAEVIKLSLGRIERLDHAIKAQRQFLQTIPDPDSRYRAEGNLMDMIMAVEALRELHMKLLESDA